MKKLITFLALITFTVFTLSTNAQQVIASAGGYYEGDNISISWTLGETVIETFEGADIILTQGFQQPYSFYLSQILNIPAGWSGISGYIDPLNKGVEDMFSPHIPDFIILASMTDFYYPDGGVNTINNWSWETGYQVKAGSEFEVTLTGSKIDPPEVDLAQNWNLIPVLTSCGATTDEVFTDMANLNIVKEVAGPNVFWPAYGIETLTDLEPGKAYWVSMDDIGGFTYPECAKSSYIAKPQEKPQNGTPWNNLSYTASSHAIAFPAKVLLDGGLQPGDFIGAFTPEGYCAGRVEVTNLTSNVAVMAFANDETTIEKDGFGFGEMLQFKVYRPQGNEELAMHVDYNEALPQRGVFEMQGLSAVKSITLEATGTNELPELITGVYPNPSKGIFTLTMSYWPEKMQIHLMDTKGRIIAVFTPGIKANGSAYQFNLDHLQKGVYFLKLVDNGIIEIKKIVIN
ncbi:MAG: hypothetical protein B6D64_07520 [Bacteroidetes bacterium 4484_276]|nr:MAG: hypothetical protein B6D64_07520 [Bacteroidetes bacterium 4484_276]